MNPDFNNITLRELHEAGEISVRAYNVCGRANISNIQGLHDYLLKNEDFINIKNCGRKSNLELLNIYKQFFSSELPQRNIQITLPDILNPLKLEEAIQTEYNKLSVRAQNSFTNYFKKRPKWELVIKDHFINRTLRLDKLRNVGAKTTIEFETFIDTAIEIYHAIKDEEASPLYLVSYELKKVIGFTISDQILLEKFSQREFPIINFLAEYTKDFFHLDDIELCVVQNYLRMPEEMLTLEDIGNRFDLTKERVRQKRGKILKKMSSYSNKLKDLLDYSTYYNIVSDYNFENGPNIICIPQDLKDYSINAEIEKYGSCFSVNMLGLIFENIYYPISIIDKIKKPDEIYSLEKYNLHKKLKGNYLLRKNVVSKSSIILLLDAIFSILCSRREKDLEIKLEDISDIELTENTVAVIELILKVEYQLDLRDRKIIFKRNTPKLVYEYAIEALERIGKPTHISEIILDIKKNNPDFDSTELGIGAAMRKVKETFIFFGRTSTFGLKKWESSFKNIKGGTIRDIAEEFLNDFETPCHISAITQYVNKYRKTDETSVMTNLKMTVEKRFVFFKDAYVGLASKNYEKLAKMQSNTYRIDNVSVDEVLSSIFGK